MRQFVPHDRRVFLLSATSLLVLSGCGSLIGPSEPPGQIYVLSPDLGASPGPAKLTFQLAVARPEASASLSTDRIALRRNLTLDYYAGAQWNDTAPKLMQNLLVEAFERNGALGFVARDVDGLHADFGLQAELIAFEARYDNGEVAPTVLIDLTVRLVSMVHREIVNAREFRKDVGATANSVTAVVSAFDLALSQLLPDIARWALMAAAQHNKD